MFQEDVDNMDDLTKEALNLIELHEGFRSLVYKDSVGKKTLGYGRNLDGNPLSVNEWNNIIIPNGITKDQGEQLLIPQLTGIINWLSITFKWFNDLTINRKLCLIDIVFNIGEGGFLKFHDTIAALEKGNYTEAASNLKNSSWYNEVGQRARNDVLLMING